MGHLLPWLSPKHIQPVQSPQVKAAVPNQGPSVPDKQGSTRLRSCAPQPAGLYMESMHEQVGLKMAHGGVHSTRERRCSEQTDALAISWGQHSGKQRKQERGKMLGPDAGLKKI